MGYPHICGTVVAAEWQPSFIHLWPGIGCPDFLRPFEDTPPPSAIVTLEHPYAHSGVAVGFFCALCATPLPWPSYNDLRHQEIFSGNFDDVTGIDVTLDGETYTLTAQKDGKERTWLCEEAEIEIGDLQDALEALTAEEFTSEKAAGQQEISLTLHLDHEDEPELTIALYRCDGSKCLAVVDGKSVAYVPRGEMVTLAEAVRAIALN